MIYSELEKVGAEGSNEFGDYIAVTFGKSTDATIEYTFEAIPSYAQFVYFKCGVCQNGVFTSPTIIKVDRDGQSHAVFPTSSARIYFDGNSEYQITGTGAVQALFFVLYDVYYEQEDSDLDDILSHLADINWPYPTGTVHYFDRSLASSSSQAISNFVGANRFSGSIDSPNSNTTCTYTWPAHKNRDVSNTIAWNTDIVDTSKSNTCTIDMNNTYIDIVGTFYLKTTQTTSSTWTFAYIPASAISYAQCATPVWVSSGLWQDESGSFSGIYLVRAGASGDTNMVGIRGIGYVRKDKATTGVVAGYANYFHIRLIPAQSAASTNYSLISYTIGQN